MTPTQLEAYLKKKRFHAAIARKAASLSPEEPPDKPSANQIRDASRPRSGDDPDDAHHQSSKDVAAEEIDDLGWLVEIGGVSCRQYQLAPISVTVTAMLNDHFWLLIGGQRRQLFARFGERALVARRIHDAGRRAARRSGGRESR